MTTSHRILALACLAGAASAVQQPIPALPAPSGTIVNVSTVAQLETALDALASNTTIMIAAGTYHLTGSQRAIGRHGAINHVAVRGATGNRADVVLIGEGMSSGSSSTAFGIKIENAQDVTFGDFSIGNVYWHPLALHADQGCQRVLMHNLRLFDGGEQLLKVNPANDGSGESIGGVNGCTVEYCLFDYTTTAPSDYTNGVDVHHGADWIIRCNLFRNIRAPSGQLAGPT